MKKYNLINNILGWFCFAVAAITYLLTIEPTASFWDCPEFIAQGAKLDIGHPPGNPIFMLTARFFVTIFGGSMQTAAIAVNTMSALLSAATILLLFWTITHLVRKIVVRDDATDIPLGKLLVIMGAGVCGALAYTWSDTFWFSAVEGEVYAFSSFCTALVFWLILKWENRADEPHSDRYLILIAYVIGVSIAVHLLNLLCIPAIVLVFYYRKFKNITAKGSLIALLVSFALVAAILYGLVPGFIKVAQGFELFFVNVLGLPFNIGVLVYAVLLVTLFIFTIRALYNRKNPLLARALFFLSIVASGLVFVTDQAIVWFLLAIAVSTYIFILCTKIPYRVFSIITLSLLVIFTGYSSYALLLIRASANPPMNQNAPDNVFTLASYLNREQYGESPLIYGPVFAEYPYLYFTGTGYVTPVDEQGRPDYVVPFDGLQRYNTEDRAVVDNGEYIYSRAVKTSPDQPDRYVKETWKPKYSPVPELNMPFTRMYSNNSRHIEGYKQWSGYSLVDLENAPAVVPEHLRNQYMSKLDLKYYMPNMVEVHHYVDSDGDIIENSTDLVWKPSFIDNLRYFFNYQLNHMYWRYFMWNFAGRQNDIQGNGEPYYGNWISGVDFIDKARLGDQSLLPEEYTTANKGHNVYYMLPLILGLLGIIWQAAFHHKANPSRGIEQFWVIFFLFFMTGVAIVLYLNQPPGQPRERDYAFAGSFYAFAIWIGMGVPAIAHMLSLLLKDKKAGTPDDVTYSTPAVAVAVAVGVLVPLQMVSQTWDDHDRSHRYTTRDFGHNYLNSLDENAIIFTNGDNDTFPLWYAQEVDSVRTDVRVVNLSYLSTDWYANQMKHPYYDGRPVDFIARPEDYAYDRLQVVYNTGDKNGPRMKATESLRQFYAAPKDAESGLMLYPTSNNYMPIDSAAVYSAFDIDPNSPDSITKIPYLADIEMTGLRGSGFGLNTLLSFDIVATSIEDGFKRPVYFASTVPGDLYLGLQPNLNSTGMAMQVTPFANAEANPLVEKAYENIVSKYKWGGLDDPEHNKGLYLDETVRRMVSSMRNSIITAATDLAFYGDLPASDFAVQWATANNLPVPETRNDMARYLLNLMEEKFPADVAPYEGLENYLIPSYLKLYRDSGNEDDLKRAETLIDSAIKSNLQFAKYAASVDNSLFYRLGSAAKYARVNIPTLLGYINYIDLIKAAGDDQDSIDMVNRIMDIDEIYGRYYDVNPLLYIYNMQADDIETLWSRSGGSRNGDAYALAYAVASLNNDLGVNSTEKFKALLDAYGITPKVFDNLSYFLR